MTPGEKCSLLLMRDDGRTLRWRMSLRLLCALAASLALLLPLLGAACWMVWDLHREKNAINLQLNQLEQENTHTVAELKRLSRLEHLLALPTAASMQAIQAQQAKNRMLGDSGAQADTGLQAESTPQDPNEQAGQGSTNNIDLKMIGVENVHARLLAGNKVRINIDLLNTQQKNQLAGHVICLIKNAQNDSKTLEIPNDIASFRINRFKRAVFVPVLPESMRKQPGLMVIIEIQLDERGLVYRNEFPVDL